MDFIRFLQRRTAMLATLCAAGLLVGCASSPSSDSTYRFNPLDQGGGGNTGSTPQYSGGQATDMKPVPMPSPAAPTGGDAGQAQSGRRLKEGDGITVTFQDLGPVGPVPPIDTTVKEDGTITLIYNKQFHAAGKTVGELEAEIRAAYVPTYFVNMTPTISLKERWFYVDGEVKAPGRQVYLTRMTVVDAIATVGGFTDYARKHKIWLIRANGKTYYVDYFDALKKKELNLEVFPDDRVIVKKRIL